MKNRPLNLIVGCGGSGLTTMESLNRLLAQNPEILPRMKDEIYYLAVDTEKKALESFERKIASHMGNYEAPFVQKILLSHQVGILNDVIRPNFIEPFARGANKGLERLRENWWFDKNGNPFVAPKVTNLPDGAGQCPPASYGLAWYRLKEIGEAIECIVNRMVRRGNGDPSQLSNMNLVVVSGLSGGTGRGCWNIITFKIREYLLDNYHVTVPPVGIFFDANVFDSVADLNRSQRLALKVNSATGISELSCWMQNGGSFGEDRFDFRIPDMLSPNDRDTDVLKVDLELNPNSGAPVSSAYLICGKSRSAILKDNSEYHEMAGAAIYAMISNPEIRARDVNNSDPYNSLGAATFEVNTLQIKEYFEAHARRLALGSLAGCVDDVSSDIDEFFSQNPINGFALDAEKGLEPKFDGTIYQRASAAFLSSTMFKQNFETIIGKLPSWDLKTAIKKIDPLLKGDYSKQISAAVKQALSGFGVKDIGGRPCGFYGTYAEAAILAWMKKVYRGKSGQKRSVGRARKFLEGLRDAINAADATSPSAMGIKPAPHLNETSPVSAVPKALEIKSKRSFKEMVKGIGPFNSDDVASIIKPFGGDCYWGLLPMAIVAANFGKIKAGFNEALRPALAKIESLISACDQFEKCCGRARECFRKEEDQSAGGEKALGKDAFSQLFATPETIDTSLCDVNDSRRFYRRILKPIVPSREELDAAVRDSIHVGDGVDMFIAGAVEDGTFEKLGSNKELERGASERFVENLMNVMRSNVSLVDSFMIDHFTFEKVLDRNRVFWNDAYKAALGSGARRTELEEKFEVTLGAVPVVGRTASSKPQLPETPELMRTIAASLVSTCAPWWITNENSYSHGVMLFVPFDCKKDRTAFDKCLNNNAPHVKVQAYGTSDSKGGVTPFSYVAFVSEGIRLTATEKNAGKHLLDKVTSLSYYNDSDVKKWLLKAEDPAGESIFSTEDDNKGIGFVSPLYVHDKKLSSYRWKPWMRGDQAAAASAENKALDAMLYGMLGMGLSDTQAKAFESKLATYGWPLPLLRFTEKGQTWTLARKTMVWNPDEGRAVANTDCVWKSGWKICTSACNLLTMLKGEGKTGLNGARKQADVKNGEKLRALLETEADAFETNVKAELGADAKALFVARTEWLVKMRDEADEEDAAVFNALIGRAKKK